ncbi:uncharacterized protein EV422DRAFT_350009 [Fimicolochytrium jonesii]|uniref:uncharacterized protein n=1 Tax=Fimicolochytrium jonesii TaxID=1396493 RepID=UPI0022FE0BB4|nr:uncharacterized protein EV422DRAFT_350009 [Fimicolochytrium jonesii]KAI8815624.1 hypothetical protein EV422DRAFT_350009 [Fimicolochytrium jonesii]
MSSYYSLLLWIGVPFLFNKARALFSASKAPQRPPRRPRSRADHLSTALLIFLAVTHLVLSVRPQPNLLQDIGVGPDDSVFKIRTAMREYMRREFQEDWVEGMNGHANTHADGTTADPSESNEAHPRAQEIAALTHLYDRLKSSSDRRRIYLRTGHTAHTECTWCLDSPDYTRYMLPLVGSSYAGMLFFLGLSTHVWRKRRWRIYGAIYLATTAAVDAYLLLVLDGGDTNTTFPLVDKKTGVAISLYDTVATWRHWAFAILCLLACVAEQRETWTDKDVVRDVLEKQTVVYNRAQAYRLARAATLADTNLRRGFLEYYKDRTALNEAIWKDLEYKESRQKALQKYNLPQLMTDAAYLSDNILQTAVNEGILPPGSFTPSLSLNNEGEVQSSSNEGEDADEEDGAEEIEPASSDPAPTAPRRSAGAVTPNATAPLTAIAPDDTDTALDLEDAAAGGSRRNASPVKKRKAAAARKRK